MPGISDKSGIWAQGKRQLSQDMEATLGNLLRTDLGWLRRVTRGLMRGFGGPSMEALMEWLEGDDSNPINMNGSSGEAEVPFASDP
jgi:hypothetical protein